jgi:diguanylate cyclase (GGDEF)-like protein
VGTIVVSDLLGDWRQRAIMLAVLWLLLAAAIVWLARRANSISRAQSELANLDDLTGLRNRRSILNTASILDRSEAHTGSLSLLMIDIDHFKTINDRFGHQVGDDMLRLVSGVLRTQVRTTDIVGRYGGEEFLVLMPDTGPEGALLVAEKVRRAVAEKVIQPVPVTISIGVATTSENDVTLDRTLSRADAALYAAKEAGRNRVHVASPQERLPTAETDAA